MMSSDVKLHLLLRFQLSTLQGIQQVAPDTIQIEFSLCHRAGIKQLK